MKKLLFLSIILFSCQKEDIDKTPKDLTINVVGTYDGKLTDSYGGLYYNQVITITRICNDSIHVERIMPIDSSFDAKLVEISGELVLFIRETGYIKCKGGIYIANSTANGICDTAKHTLSYELIVEEGYQAGIVFFNGKRR
jgi:hypothetical protein